MTAGGFKADGSVVDCLQNWLSCIEDYKNNILEQLQTQHLEFENAQSAASRYVNSAENSSIDSGNIPWTLYCEHIITQAIQEAKSGRENVIKCTLNDVCFEGRLDQNGNGFGVLKKFNKVSGLYEHSATGKFGDGKLEGKVRERKSCSSFCDVYYEKGIRNGAFRKFHVSKKFQEVGFYRNDYKTKQFCKKHTAGCYFIGERPVTGGLSDPCFFIYPDLQSVIIGRFEINDLNNDNDIKLINGYFGKIIRFTWSNGILVPEVSETQSTLYKFDPSNDRRLSQDPMLNDPYESANVFVAQSKLCNAGEGLFSRRFISKYKLISFYNGVRYTKTRSGKGKSYKWSDYRLLLNNFIDLDIPAEYTSMDNYRATLAHKACHAFDKEINANFETFFHPRFGQIMSLVATCDIEPHEEILVDYNYKDIDKAPNWYKNLWLMETRKEAQKAEQVRKDERLFENFSALFDVNSEFFGGKYVIPFVS